MIAYGSFGIHVRVANLDAYRQLFEMSALCVSANSVVDARNASGCLRLSAIGSYCALEVLLSILALLLVHRLFREHSLLMLLLLLFFADIDAGDRAPD